MLWKPALSSRPVSFFSCSGSRKTRARSVTTNVSGKSEQNRPNVASYLSAAALSAGMVITFPAALPGGRLAYLIVSPPPAYRRPVSEAPRGEEVVGVVGRLPPVEVDDLADDVLVAVGVGDDRVRGEVEAIGLQHQVIGDPAGRLQVLLQERRRHGQRLGRVVE